MTLNSIVIRVSAGLILLTGGILFAAQSGVLGSPGNAQTRVRSDDGAEQTFTSSSRPSGPILPEIQASSDVLLPMIAQPVAPAAMVVPTSFDDRSPGVPNALSTLATPLSDLGLPCNIDVAANAIPGAMVALDVMAPCRPGTAVSIVHSGLRITAETDVMGLLTLDIPAFETPAFFSVTFADGTEETVLVELPDFSEFDRIGLAWQDDMGLELHAMEFGAAFGEQGHVWLGAPGVAEAALSGEGGFLTALDTGDSHVQIYTLPRATLRAGDSVRLSIDAPVTETNCARNVVARTLRAGRSGPVAVTELTFTMPSCDAVGDVLVLQNLLQDLRLASN